MSWEQREAGEADFLNDIGVWIEKKNGGKGRWDRFLEARQLRKALQSSDQLNRDLKEI